MFIFLSLFPLLPTVSQLQQTLASVQELLVQQQQKIQELSQELAAAEVVTLVCFSVIHDCNLTLYDIDFNKS